MNDRRDRARRALSLALLVGAAVSLTACGEDEPTPRPQRLDQKPATLVALPSATDEPTSTPAPTNTPDAEAQATMNAAAMVSGEDVMVQFARIEARDSEPAILSQMHPNFSLRANGTIVYTFEDGRSIDGWYQTVLTPTLGEAFVRRLWDDIGIAELAEKLPAPKLEYGYNAGGQGLDPGPVGVIYVQTKEGDARLVILQKDLEAPTGPFANRQAELWQVIQALEHWRNATETVTTADFRLIITLELGWWQERREPWSPDEVVAHAQRLPDGASRGPAVVWPLATPSLADRVDAGPDAKPDRVNAKGEDAAALIRSELTRGEADEAMIWDEGGTRYRIGLQPVVPGGNQVNVAYSFRPLATAAPPATATGRATATATARATIRRASATPRASATRKP